MNTVLSSNIEIKARASDFIHQKELAKALSDLPEELLVQEDTFFNVPRGRLKLRVFSPEEGELIYYERANQNGPKQSNYRISETSNPVTLKTVLSSALGVLGIVKKERRLFLAGQTRIHFDVVEELGEFIELEVVMQEKQSLEECQLITQELMQKLKIKKKDLIEGAYLDLLREAEASV